MAKRKPKPKPGAEKSAPSDEAGFVAYLEANPNDATAHAAFADWLDEHGRPIEAAEQRAAAGLSEVYYKLRRKSDGLFSESREGNWAWTTKGKTWRTLIGIRTHIAYYRTERHYGRDDPLTDLEIVVFEVRPAPLATLPLTFKKPRFNRDVQSVVAGETV